MNKLIPIKELQPNNWFLNKEKVKAIKKIWNKGQQDRLPSILISKIDSRLALIDGNTRVFVTWEKEQSFISAILKDVSKIDNNERLYKYLYRKGQEEGISAT